MKRLRRGREFWERLLEEYQRSGESQQGFAARRHVSVSTLQCWLYRLRREESATAEADGAKLRLVEVKASATTVPDRSPSVELELPGGVQVRVGADSDVVAVAELIALVVARVRC